MKAILGRSVSLCAIAMTGMDVIKRLECATMASVPMAGVEAIVNKVWNCCCL